MSYFRVYLFSRHLCILHITYCYWLSYSIVVGELHLYELVILEFTEIIIMAPEYALFGKYSVHLNKLCILPFLHGVFCEVQLGENG